MVVMMIGIGCCIVRQKGPGDGHFRTTWIEQYEFQRMETRPVYEFLKGDSEVSRKNSLKLPVNYPSMKNIHRSKYSNVQQEPEMSGLAGRRFSIS
jgi:hypothetical protein